MLSDYVVALRKHCSRLHCLLNRIDDLINWLLEQQHIPQPTWELIKNCSTECNAAEELVSFLLRDERDTYNLFLAGLIQTNQNHIYQLLTDKGWCVFY